MLGDTKISMIIERSDPAIQFRIYSNDQLKYECLISQKLSFVINFQISLPTQMILEVSNIKSNSFLKVQQMYVGPIKLSDTLMSQIFVHDMGNGGIKVSPVCYEDGKIAVDFFSSDWVQYHLLTRNQFL